MSSCGDCRSGVWRGPSGQTVMDHVTYLGSYQGHPIESYLCPVGSIVGCMDACNDLGRGLNLDGVVVCIVSGRNTSMISYAAATLVGIGSHCDEVIR